MLTVVLQQTTGGFSWNHLEPNPVVWFLHDEQSPLNQPRVLETSRLWARLAPLPASTTQLQISAAGELFSKRYVVSFEATVDDIKTWLADSPGPSAYPPERLPDGTMKYRIEPRDAAFAEVDVSADQQHVKIRAAWSDEFAGQ